MNNDDTSHATSPHPHEPCEAFEVPLGDLMAGTLDDADLPALSAHLRSCETCGSLFDLHDQLSSLDAVLLAPSGVAPKGTASSSPPSNAVEESEMPSETEFATVRRAVVAQLRGGVGKELEGEPEVVGGPNLSQPGRFASSARVGSSAVGPSRTVALGLAAAVAFCVFGAGWWASAQFGDSGDVQLVRVADGRELLPMPLDGDPSALQQFDIDNLRLRELGGDRVAVSFDAATYVEKVVPRSDPLVREAVVRSIRGAADLGGRINAIEQTRSLELLPMVRDALIAAMLDDPDVAVRLEAQQRLAQTELDNEVVAASLRVLETEESVQMRLLAVDMLTAQRVAPDRLREAIEAGAPEPGNALRVRADNYERLY